MLHCAKSIMSRYIFVAIENDAGASLFQHRLARYAAFTNDWNRVNFASGSSVQTGGAYCAAVNRGVDFVGDAFLAVTAKGLKLEAGTGANSFRQNNVLGSNTATNLTKSVVDGSELQSAAAANAVRQVTTQKGRTSLQAWAQAADAYGAYVPFVGQMFWSSVKVKIGNTQLSAYNGNSLLAFSQLMPLNNGENASLSLCPVPVSGAGYFDFGAWEELCSRDQEFFVPLPFAGANPSKSFPSVTASYQPLEVEVQTEALNNLVLANAASDNVTLASGAALSDSNTFSGAYLLYNAIYVDAMEKDMQLAKDRDFILPYHDHHKTSLQVAAGTSQTVNLRGKYLCYGILVNVDVAAASQGVAGLSCAADYTGPLKSLALNLSSSVHQSHEGNVASMVVPSSSGFLSSANKESNYYMFALGLNGADTLTTNQAQGAVNLSKVDSLSMDLVFNANVSGTANIHITYLSLAVARCIKNVMAMAYL